MVAETGKKRNEEGAHCEIGNPELAGCRTSGESASVESKRSLTIFQQNEAVTVLEVATD
jgi:hypothetical protein